MDNTDTEAKLQYPLVTIGTRLIETEGVSRAATLYDVRAPVNAELDDTVSQLISGPYSAPHPIRSTMNAVAMGNYKNNSNNWCTTLRRNGGGVQSAIARCVQNDF